MIRNFLLNVLGFSVTILSVKDGDTIIFEARDDLDRATLDWFEASLKRHFKKNLVILQGVKLKQVLRRDGNI